MIVRARAPLRVELAGGGTDCTPWMKDRGSYLLNASINRYATASAYSRKDKDGKPILGTVVDLVDLNVAGHRLVSTRPVSEEEVARVLRERQKADPSKQEILHSLKNEDVLAMVKACMNFLDLGEETPVYLHARSDSPPGTGLGSSSSIVVAVLMALARWKYETDGQPTKLHYQRGAPDEGPQRFDEITLARTAWEIERKVLGKPGGWQDHVSAVWGRFNAIRTGPGAESIFEYVDKHGDDGSWEHDCWWPGQDVVDELEECSVLAYVGRRDGRDYIESLRLGMRSDALAGSMAKAKQAHEALKKGDLREFGLFVEDAWKAKLRCAPSLTNERVANAYSVARGAGAIGGCLVGAGGGGFLYLYCEPQMRWKVIDALLKLNGVYVWPFGFEQRGARTWTVAE